jgi:hypothetical protein
MRWNSASVRYEVMPNGSSEWDYLRYRTGTAAQYDVFNPAGALLGFRAEVNAPTAAPALSGYMGDTRLSTGATGAASLLAHVVMGLATAPGDLPTTGVRTCTVTQDELGGGQLIVDFAARTVTGYVRAESSFTQPGPQLPLAATSVAPTQVPAFATTYGTTAGNILEARFYGPQGANIAIRLKGELAGLMLGACPP